MVSFIIRFFTHCFGQYVDVSDVRLKTNIMTLEEGMLDKIMKIQGVSYEL